MQGHEYITSIESQERHSECVQKQWVDVLSTIFPSSELSIRGEIPSDKHKPCIIIANHQLDVDWWYIWMIAKLSGNAGNIKIILKAEVKFIPVFGWGMQMFDFLFLSRQLIQDSTRIENHIHSFIEDNFPYWIVMFPEGTTIHGEALEKSQAFAAKTQRPQFDNLLLPRSAGLEVLLEAIAKADPLVYPDIYDMTMIFDGYSGEIPMAEHDYELVRDTTLPTLESFLKGHGPEKVHITSTRYAFKDVRGQVVPFLDRCWQAKQSQLSHYIEHGVVEPNEALEVPSQLSGPRRQKLSTAPPDGYLAVLRLWLSIGVFVIFLPILLFIFFPSYMIWVLYTLAKALLNVGKNKWIPYCLRALSSTSSRLKKQF